MENDDLFVDDDEEMGDAAAAAPPKGASKKGGKQPSKKSSKQVKSPAKAEAKAKPKSEPEKAVTVTDDSQSISLMLASILVIAAFVVGFAAGGLLFGQSSSSDGSQFIGPSTPSGMPGGAPSGSAPAGPLSEDEVQKGLPKGHPQVPDGSTTPTENPSK
ncbi:MAG: hypothetical protein C4521_10800 [Actinobacteria bacterium]|nr:MAG: hypothetical protein C4521_10800 [Actinomycetota bacterium]